MQQSIHPPVEFQEPSFVNIRYQTEKQLWSIPWNSYVNLNFAY